MNKLIQILFYLSIISFTCINLSCSITDSDTPYNEEIDVSHFTVENFPRIDGSTSNQPMMTVLACEIFGLKYNWVNIGDGTMLPYPELDSTKEKEKEIDFIRKLVFNKTIRAYERLIYDSTDVILVANEPSADHTNLANSMGVNFKVAPIALDGLVFMVNSKNPINNLTSNQVLDIFTGSIKKWNMVGGNNDTISPYIRNKNSGSQELMEKLVFQGRQIVSGRMESSMMGLLLQLSFDELGIGYTVYYYSSTMVPLESVKRISINGVEANKGTISSGEYQYTAPVYAIIRSDLSKNSTAYQFWKWLQTKAGQDAIEKSGYVRYTK